MIAHVLKEPILHFLLAGAVIFAAFFVLDEPDPEGRAVEIVITPQIVERLAAQHQASWRRSPNIAEINALIDSYVREEVLVREAKALSLDKDDTVIRQRLQQKMSFIAKSAAAAVTADEAELKAYFSENEDRYVRGGAIAFEQVFLGTSPKESEIARALDELASGRDPAEVGSSSLLPFKYPLTVAQKIDGMLGPNVYAALEALEPGVWSGPVRTGYGVHLARITDLRPPEMPNFATVRENVLLDWRASIEAKLSKAQLDRMMARYSVERPKPDEIRSIVE